MENRELVVVFMMNDSASNDIHKVVLAEWLRQHMVEDLPYSYLLINFNPGGYGRSYLEQLNIFKNTFPESTTDVLLITQVPCSFTLEVYYHIVSKVGQDRVRTLYTRTLARYEPIELRSMGLVGLEMDDEKYSNLKESTQCLTIMNRHPFGNWTADIAAAVRVNTDKMTKPVPHDLGIGCYWNVI